MSITNIAGGQQRLDAFLRLVAAKQQTLATGATAPIASRPTFSVPNRSPQVARPEVPFSTYGMSRTRSMAAMPATLQSTQSPSRMLIGKLFDSYA